MSAFKASFRNELSKLFRRKKYMVFLIFGLVICIIGAAVSLIVSHLVGRATGVVMFNLTPTPMGVLPIFLQGFLPLLIFMGATDLLTVEASEGTMKGIIFRPVERWKLYFSKIAAIVAYAAFYLTCIFVLSTLLNLIVGRGMGMGELFSALISYALTLPPLAVLAAFAGLIAILGRSSSLTMLLLIVAYIAMNAIPLFFPIASEMIFVSYLGWYRLWIGVLPSASRLLHMSTILASYGVVFFVAGSLVFERKEY